MQLKWGAIRATRKRRTKFINLFHQGLFVAWPRILFRAILWENGEQLHVNMCGWTAAQQAQCIISQDVYNLITWEQTMQEYYGAQLCYRADSQPARKATDKFKSVSVQLSIAADFEWTIHWNQRQQSVNNFWSSKFGNWKVIWSLLCISDIMAAFIGKKQGDTVTTPFWEWVSTERQWCSALNLG